MKLLVATNNHHKYEEYKRMLIKRGIEVVDLESIKAPKYREGNISFMDNAMGKAYFYSQFTEYLALSDDSGIVIPALGGFPSVQSARFGIGSMNQKEKNEYILKEMENLNGSKRVAYFICALAVAKYQKILFYTEERVKGLIGYEAKGENGFGYDPIFYYLEKEKTFAQMSAEEKDQVSHRGKAVRAFLQWLERKSSECEDE